MQAIYRKWEGKNPFFEKILNIANQGNLKKNIFFYYC